MITNIQEHDTNSILGGEYVFLDLGKVNPVNWPFILDGAGCQANKWY